MLRGRNQKSLLLIFGILTWTLAFTPQADGRDPKREEIPAIQEIASYLIGDTAQLTNDFRAYAGTHPQIDWALPLIEKMNQRAWEFHERLKWNAKSPWRTTNTYEELADAFSEARDAFLLRSTYSVNPPAFEEIAYLMESLLQYYLYPGEQGPFYSSVVAAPVYTWVPTFYTYSSCRRFPFWKGPPLRTRTKF